MTMFEQRGVDRQYSAGSVTEATRAFEQSCEICATTGKYISCANCMIANVHQLITEIFIRR